MKTTMARTKDPLPETLQHHLSAVGSNELASTAEYVDRGGRLTGSPALAALTRLMPVVTGRIRELPSGDRLRRRLEVLTTYFCEARSEGLSVTVVQREVAFALLYFLKGADRIPDTIPDVGLLDDALVAKLVLERHSAALRVHWARRGRSWPEDLLTAAR